MTTKTCFKCGQTKNRGEFYAHVRMADGLLGKCKDCTKKDSREHRQRYLQDPANLAKERERSRRHSARARAEGRLKIDPEKRKKAIQRYRIKASLDGRTRARSAVGNALRDGRLVREPCLVCGDTKVHAHHEDYTKPLEVMWLCTKHHGEIHRKC